MTSCTSPRPPDGRDTSRLQPGTGHTGKFEQPKSSAVDPMAHLGHGLCLETVAVVAAGPRLQGLLPLGPGPAPPRAQGLLPPGPGPGPRAQGLLPPGPGPRPLVQVLAWGLLPPGLGPGPLVQGLPPPAPLCAEPCVWARVLPAWLVLLASHGPPHAAGHGSWLAPRAPPGTQICHPLASLGKPPRRQDPRAMLPRPSVDPSRPGRLRRPQMAHLLPRR